MLKNEEKHLTLDECKSMAAFFQQFGPHTALRLLENDGYDIEMMQVGNNCHETVTFEDNSVLRIIDGNETYVE